MHKNFPLRALKLSALTIFVISFGATALIAGNPGRARDPRAAAPKQDNPLADVCGAVSARRETRARSLHAKPPPLAQKPGHANSRSRARALKKRAAKLNAVRLNSNLATPAGGAAGGAGRR